MNFQTKVVDQSLKKVVARERFARDRREISVVYYLGKTINKTASGNKGFKLIDLPEITCQRTESRGRNNVIRERLTSRLDPTDTQLIRSSIKERLAVGNVQ